MAKIRYIKDGGTGDIVLPMTHERGVEDSNGVNLETKLSRKQDVIPDLDQIRSGASSGANAYEKPAGGIPASDIAPGVIPDVSKFVTKNVNNLTNYYTKSKTYSKMQMDSALELKQDTLVSGTNIKTINNQSLLGSGNINIESGSTDTSDCVKIISQSFTSNQKAIARSNIGAGTSSFSGSYNDLTDKPSIPSGQIQSDWNQTRTTEPDFIKNKPSIPSVAGLENVSNKVTSISSSSTDTQYPSAKCVYTELGEKQDVIDDLSDIRSGAALGNTAYQKPVSGIPANDLAAGVIPVVPTISTNIKSDKTSNTKTASPKAVYNEVNPVIVTSQPSGGMAPNVFYSLGLVQGNVSFSFASPSDSNIVNHYYWTFETASTAPVVTWPSGITAWVGGSAPTISASKHYEVSVINGMAVYIEF